MMAALGSLLLTGHSKAQIEMQSAVRGFGQQTQIAVSDVGAAKLAWEATVALEGGGGGGGGGEQVGTGVADYIPVKKLGQGVQDPQLSFEGQGQGQGQGLGAFLRRCC